MMMYILYGIAIIVAIVGAYWIVKMKNKKKNSFEVEWPVEPITPTEKKKAAPIKRKTKTSK